MKTTPLAKNGHLAGKTGNEAMAEAMRQIAPDVVAAYPITPATEIVQIFSQFVADGLVPTEYVAVESEHSAMSACIGAAAAGARTMTGTSSQGLALMWEMLYIASGLRLPVIMSVVNRALSAPVNIHADHGDSMGARDSGWVQIYSENAQEAYDNLIQAVRIAETVGLPVMVTTDGFIISHCMEGVRISADEQVRAFVGTRQPERCLLDVARPYTLGAIDLQDYCFEHRYQVYEAMRGAAPVILEVARDFHRDFGREYGLYEKYRMDDAETALVIIGSAAGTAKVVIDDLRSRGVKAGLIKIRVFRPFAHAELARDLAGVKALAVMDRSDSCSAAAGPLYTEVTSALYTHLRGNGPQTVGIIYGLGGRDIDEHHFADIFRRLEDIRGGSPTGEPLTYVNLRE